MTRLLAAAIVVSFAVAMGAQSATPVFEVASIRQEQPGVTGGRAQFLQGGRFIAQNVPLEFIVQQVYGVRAFQVIVNPTLKDAMTGPRYNIQATGDAAATRAQLQEMAKTLLADRFGLKLHTEQRPMPVYALVVAERGIKGVSPRDEKPPGGIMLMAPGWIRGQRITLAQIAQYLTGQLDRPVVDLTKLDQYLQFDLTFTPDGLVAGGAAPEPGCSSQIRMMAEKMKWTIENLTCPSIFTAVEEQLGLKLQAQTAPIEVLVIDDVRAPTEN